MPVVHVEEQVARRPGIARGMGALLGVAMLLNYADRGSLSTVSPVLKDELGINNTQLGLLLSSFFWTYSLSQPVAGWIAQRYPVRIVLAIGVGLWSLATMACGLAAGFASLFALRMVLGLGESVIFPASARIITEQSREDQRGTANGISMVGLALGPTLGTIIGALILRDAGWRWVFYSLGGCSLLWLIPWLCYRGSRAPARLTDITTPAPYAQILCQKALWGTCLGQFCYSYPAYMLLTWLPIFLVKVQHLSVGQMGLAGGLIYLCQAMAAAIGGIASDRLIRKARWSVNTARKAFVSGGLSIAIVGLVIASATHGRLLSTVGIVLLAIGIGLCQPMVFTIGQTLAGPRASARWIGIQNMAGNFAGVAAPILTGWLADRTGSFAASFGAAAAFGLAGIVCWQWIVPRVEETRWSTAVQQ